MKLEFESEIGIDLDEIGGRMNWNFVVWLMGIGKILILSGLTRAKLKLNVLNFGLFIILVFQIW